MALTRFQKAEAYLYDGARLESDPLLVYRGNPAPNPFLCQTRAQRQQVAAEKEKQGHRSMWRRLCRHMTSWPCFDVVPVVGLEPTRGISPTDFESVTSTIPSHRLF